MRPEGASQATRDVFVVVEPNSEHDVFTYPSKCNLPYPKVIYWWRQHLDDGFIFVTRKALFEIRAMP
jgi:hypothetical protein